LAKELSRARTKYVDAQIKAESGFKGALIKTGLKSLEKSKGLDYLFQARDVYYDAH